MPDRKPDALTPSTTDRPGALTKQPAGDLVARGLADLQALKESTQRSFSFWYVRVYAWRDNRWQYLSHRTVHGPVYEK